MKPAAFDVRVYDHGSVVTFLLRTGAARAWVDANVQSESWQWLGRYALVIDHRLAPGLIDAMHVDGLRLSA